MNFSDSLRAAIIESDFTENSLATEIGVSASTIHRFMKGKTSPSLTLADEMLDALKKRSAAKSMLSGPKRNGRGGTLPAQRRTRNGGRYALENGTSPGRMFRVPNPMYDRWKERAKEADVCLSEWVRLKCES